MPTETFVLTTVLYQTTNEDGSADPDGRYVFDPDSEEGALTLIGYPGMEIPISLAIAAGLVEP